MPKAGAGVIVTGFSYITTGACCFASLGQGGGGRGVEGEGVVFCLDLRELS